MDSETLETLESKTKILVDALGSISQPELADKLGVDTSVANRVLSSLEDDGILRERSEEYEIDLADYTN